MVDNRPQGTVLAGDAIERTVQYLRHEPFYEPEAREARLSLFVYDVPYLDACGIFPPLHILNAMLRSGGGDGGMSPGSSWQPFEISEEEYRQALPSIFQPNLDELREKVRFSGIPIQIDSDFDHIQDRFEWMQAVCIRHRDQHHQAIREMAQRLNSNG
jgi:hypothetical protein